MSIIYAPTPENPLTTLQKIRNQRLYLLLDSDWTQAADVPLSASKKAEWATYRQALRDLPANHTDDDNFSDVVFPTPPT